MDERLFTEVKQVAARTGRTFTAVVEDALRQMLSREQHRTSSARPTLPTFPGGELRPGVDLDDSAALLDLMDAEADPA
jgi:hypothetical protein